MLINTVNKKIKVNKVPVREYVTNWMEQDIIVPDSKPDSVKILCVNVNCYLKEKHALDGKIKVSGNLDYYVMYKSDNNELVSLKYNSPFTQVMSVKNITKDMKLNVIPKINKCLNTLPNERKISIKTEVLFKVVGCEYKEINVLEKFEDDYNIQTKNDTLKLNNIELCKKSNIISKEDVMIPNENSDIKEIVKVDYSIINKDYKKSYNKVMLKADMKLDIMYITNLEVQDLRKFSIIIPITGMSEIENMTDDSKFEIDYYVSNLKVDLNDTDMSKVMKVEYDISCDITMYNNLVIDYIKDFYSENMDLKYNMVKNSIVTDFKEYRQNLDLNENLTGILKENIKILDYSLDINDINVTTSNSNVVIEGSFKLNLLIQNTDTLEIENKEIEVLVNNQLPLENINSDANLSSNINTKDVNVVQNGTNVDLKYKLDVVTKEELLKDVDIVDKIEANEEVLVEDLDSMYLYTVKEGDTLWDISKKYKTTVDKIVDTNNIQDEDNIVVGDKLLIIR